MSDAEKRTMEGIFKINKCNGAKLVHVRASEYEVYELVFDNGMTLSFEGMYGEPTRITAEWK